MTCLSHLVSLSPYGNVLRYWNAPELNEVIHLQCKAIETIENLEVGCKVACDPSQTSLKWRVFI